MCIVEVGAESSQSQHDLHVASLISCEQLVATKERVLQGLLSCVCLETPCQSSLHLAFSFLGVSCVSPLSECIDTTV